MVDKFEEGGGGDGSVVALVKTFRQGGQVEREAGGGGLGGGGRLEEGGGLGDGGGLGVNGAGLGVNGG